MNLIKAICFLVLITSTSLPSTTCSAQAPLVEDLGYRGGSIPGIQKPANALHFIAFGDWGRNGENYQQEVANGMGKAAHDLNASFVVATGDNFYPNGVASTQDYHWIASFETIYRAQSLHFPWYPVLGNHDYLGNPDAQIEYSKISGRWRMPSRYYSRGFNEKDTSRGLLMVFLDTDPMEKELRGHPYDEVKYVEGAVAKQMKWLDSTLAASKAKWKIVVGHHPLYTGGWRHFSPDVDNLKGFLEPVFAKHAVDVYLCGHEHHLEHIKPAGKTHYVISGGGSEARPGKLHPNGGMFFAPTQGFATFSVSAAEVMVQFIDYKDQIMHTSNIRKN